MARKSNIRVANPCASSVRLIARMLSILNVRESAAICQNGGSRVAESGCMSSIAE